MSKKGLALIGLMAALILGGSTVAYRLSFDTGMINDVDAATAERATAVVEEFLKACRSGRLDKAKDCFGVENIGGSSVDSWIGLNYKAFASRDVYETRPVDAETVEVPLTAQKVEKLTNLGFSSRIVEQAPVFTVGLQADGSWKIVNLEIQEKATGR